MAIIKPYKGVFPKIADSAFIAEDAVIIGDVEIGEESNIWYGCVIRGDVNSIKIGARTNIQDGSVVHVTREIGPTVIGDDVTIGHKAMLHACNLSDKSFVGMGAIVMDFACLEENSMLAAGAILTPNKTVKTGEIWAGNPAKKFRELNQKEIDFITISADNYVRLGREYG